MWSHLHTLKPRSFSIGSSTSNDLSVLDILPRSTDRGGNAYGSDLGWHLGWARSDSDMCVFRETCGPLGPPTSLSFRWRCFLHILAKWQNLKYPGPCRLVLSVEPLWARVTRVVRDSPALIRQHPPALIQDRGVRLERMPCSGLNGMSCSWWWSQ